MRREGRQTNAHDVRIVIIPIRQDVQDGYNGPLRKNVCFSFIKPINLLGRKEGMRILLQYWYIYIIIIYAIMRRKTHHRGEIVYMMRSDLGIRRRIRGTRDVPAIIMCAYNAYIISTRRFILYNIV